MREISLENLYLLLLGEHLGDWLSCLSATHRHCRPPPSPLLHGAHHPAPTPSPLRHLAHSLTPLFPLTLSCSTAISLLHLAIKTRVEAKGENTLLYFHNPSSSSSYQQHNLSGFLYPFFSPLIRVIHMYMVRVKNPEFTRMAGMELINKGNCTPALSGR